MNLLSAYVAMKQLYSPFYHVILVQWFDIYSRSSTVSVIKYTKINVITTNNIFPWIDRGNGINGTGNANPSGAHVITSSFYGSSCFTSSCSFD